MKKSQRLFCTLFLIVLTQATTVEAHAQSDPNKFKNCTELKKVFPKGVARNVKTAQQSGAPVNLKVYVANKRLDRDADGSVCESFNTEAGY